MISVDDFVSLGHSRITVDVRTSEEYKTGHIPGALNIPLLNEEERAEIGILYKKTGREKALDRGLEIIGPKLYSIYKAIVTASDSNQFELLRHSELLRHCEQSEAIPLIIYCWRGGLRSRFVTSMLNFMDLRCNQLEGGYKSYRRWVLKQFESYKPEELLVIDGFTGSGKTKLLIELKANDYPVIDLEALASHKGSVFGDISSPPQPTQQQFENSLAEELLNIGRVRPIILEGESRRIGFLQIPKPFFETMDKASRLMIDETLEKRVENIYEEYIKSTPQDILADRVLKLEKHLGRERCKELLAELHSGDVKVFVKRILNEHYDKVYMKSYKRRQDAGQLVYSSRNDREEISNWLRESC